MLQARSRPQLVGAMFELVALQCCRGVPNKLRLVWLGLLRSAGPFATLKGSLHSGTSSKQILAPDLNQLLRPRDHHALSRDETGLRSWQSQNPSPLFFLMAKRQRSRCLFREKQVKSRCRLLVVLDSFRRTHLLFVSGPAPLAHCGRKSCIRPPAVLGMAAKLAHHSQYETLRRLIILHVKRSLSTSHPPLLFFS